MSPGPGAARRLAAPEVTAEAADWLADLLTFWREKYPDVEVAPDVAHASPARVLAGASARADLVVLGRNSTDDSGQPSTGATAHALLSHAHSPVAIVPE